MISPPKDVFDSTNHHISFFSSEYYLHDTAGLSETRFPTPADALTNLYDFTAMLSDGIDLLVYVARHQPTDKNYKISSAVQ